ncbi:GNAT family N-acetyltransferase [Roseibium sp. FZY0029]|uniref:GNAT family N-acetyltransferase n=1 Tax=Roseibium sp. FZY0029 TaxID=3116647 RepID=UPI002EB7326E|nr:GNAT family N-acetyltransferase [Roseibium sp. FZY0029]
MSVPHSNPYQSPSWLCCWFETIGRSLNCTPVIVVARRQGEPVVILPLQLETSAGTSTLTFLGHQNGNQNTGLWNADFYGKVTPAEMKDMLSTVCRQTGADLVKLQNVPDNWHGRSHPLVLEGATPSPSPVFACALPADFGKLFNTTHSKSARKNLLRKERHLRDAGNYRVAKAVDLAERQRGLDAFFEQRAVRARVAGIPNVFSQAPARAFLSSALGLQATFDRQANAPAPLDLWYLETGGHIRATYLCAEHGKTLYAYSNSVAHDDMLANSPGLVLIKEIIERACVNPRFDTLDLGLGEERYKTGWAEPVLLKDSLLAMSWKGTLRLRVEAARLQTKTRLRNSATLWPLIRRLRKWKAGIGRGG